MDFKIKEVSAPDTKSVAEVEEQLINEVEARNEGVEATEEVPVVEAKSTEGGIPVINLDAPAPSNDTETEVEATEEAPVEEVAEEVVTDTNDTDSSLNEENVLSFLKNKYGRDVSSLEELVAEPESSGDSKELPEDVAAYLQYKEKTGRGMGDYMKLTRSFEDADPDTLLREYLSDTESDLDAEDIADLMEDYIVDEDVMLSLIHI